MAMQDRSWSRKATIGASALAGLIAVAALGVVLIARPEEAATSQAASAVPETVVAPRKPSRPGFDYTLNLSTGSAKQLPDALIGSVAGFGRSPSTKYAASRDGSMLAYVGHGDDANPQIFVSRIDGSGARQLTNDVREAMSPAWSPNGTRIAYIGYGSKWAGNRRHLFVVDVATGISTRVPGATGTIWDAQFTPDGRSILYTGGPPSAPVLRSVPVAGGRSTVFLAPSEGLSDTGNGSVSPDGSLVTFLGGGWPKEAGHHCGPCRFVANADGSDRRVVPGCFESSPAGTWSPDGRRIVCTTNTQFGKFSVMVVDIATGKASRVAEGRSAIWLDRQTLLIDVA
jgi:Tol biopolymer transport system component